MERIQICVDNPFGAPVYRVAETDSTMREARELADSGAPSGTVIVADFQTEGRGRIEGRIWTARAGESLLCTIILREIPVNGFTLRVGLAAAEALDAFLPPPGVAIKWPNDILTNGKKLAGILCENDGSTVYAGTGFNIAQKSFPPELAKRATSIAMELPEQAPVPGTLDFLAVYLQRLYSALSRDDWHERVSARLWRRGEDAVFLAGDPGKREEIRGRIEGIGPSGELLIRSGSPEGDVIHRLFSGEFPYGDTTS